MDKRSDLVEAAQEASQEQSIYDALDQLLTVRYQQLEAALKKRWPQYLENRPFLNFQFLGFEAEIRELFNLIDPNLTSAIAAELLPLLQQTARGSAKLASDLLESVGEQNKPNVVYGVTDVQTVLDKITLDLAGVSQQFANQAAVVVSNGIKQSHGLNQIAGVLRATLGKTKGQAIAVTRTMNSEVANLVTEAQYQSMGIELVQLYATSSERTCPYCVARHLNVYKLGTIHVPVHVQCRCTLLPFRPEWMSKDIFSPEDMVQSRSGVLAELSKLDKVPNYGLTPSEKYLGLTKTIQPVWEPGKEMPKKWAKV